MSFPPTIQDANAIAESDTSETQVGNVSLVNISNFPSISSVLPPTGSTIALGSLASISKVPRDVLARIFYWLQSCKHGCYGWLRATRVCRLWREVFLENPRLWAQITGAKGLGPEGTRAMLSRAKMAPVQICFRTDDDDDDHFGDDSDDTADVLVDYIPQHISHIQSLDLAHPFWFADLLEKLTQPAPLLEEFSIYGSFDFEGLTPLPLTLFNGEAPRLRHLTIVNLAVDWTLPILKNLTSLRACNLDVGAPLSDVDVPLLLACLENMPRLENLAIQARRPRLDGVKIAGERGVALPHLVDMQLDMSLLQILMLVNTLKIPPDTSIDLRTTCTFVISPHPAHANLFHFFFAHSTRGMPLKFLTFYQRGPRNLNVLVESHRMGNVSLAKSHSLFIDWSEGFHSPVTFIEIMIITAPRNLFLSLDRIVFLQIDWDEVFSPLGFTHMLLFSELGNLTAIQISLMYFASFVEALGTKSQLSIHANRPLPPTEYKERSVYCLPSLQVISVVTSPIPEYHGSEFVRRVLEQAKPPSHLPALLLNVLTERRERGMYMHTIEFLPALCDPSPDPNIWYEFLKPAMEGIVHLVGPDSEKYICGTDTKLPSTKYAGCSFGAFTL